MGLKTGCDVFALELVAVLFDEYSRKNFSRTVIPLTRKGPFQLDAKVFPGRTSDLSQLKAFKLFLGR